jgi:hypothetical protein
MYSNKSTFQVLAVVNENATPPGHIGGPPAPEMCVGAPSSVECYVTSRVAEIVEKLWPAFIMANLMTASFWFGERIVYLRYFHHKSGGIKIA